ncbi:MAG: hypothetical protein RR891_06890 [Clostridium sp.]|uniref:hypothetical protein n=1 Tax=Clostridium sp. TaxID=1506 RepID=UPI0030393F21
MNAYELVMKIKQKMNDPVFATKFNNASDVINRIPGLQQEIIKIAQIKDEKSQNEAIARLPKEAKEAVKDILYLLNN